MVRAVPYDPGWIQTHSARGYKPLATGPVQSAKEPGAGAMEGGAAHGRVATWLPM
jgi:hypothetical protein